MDCIGRWESPLGGITLAGDGEALVGLWFEGQKHFAASLSRPLEEKKLPLFAEAERWLEVYFRGEEPDFTPPLRLRGTAFQREVWELLLLIPYGQTTSYGELARVLAARRNSTALPTRAVGAAVGRNPISLIVPCHRVLGGDGALRGYAGGLDRKSALLRLERSLR